MPKYVGRARSVQTSHPIAHPTPLGGVSAEKSRLVKAARQNVAIGSDVTVTLGDGRTQLVSGTWNTNEQSGAFGDGGYLVMPNTNPQSLSP